MAFKRKNEAKLTPLAPILGRFLFVLMLGMTMNACSSSEKWKEEVQLSDGRVVVVDREMTREVGGDEWASNRGGVKPKEYRIRLAYPVGSEKMIEWHSTKKDDGMWPEVPLVFDIKSEQPIIFSLVAISICCEIYSKYVYHNGKWIEEPLPEQFEQHTTNLLFGSQRNLPAFVNLEEKRKRNSDAGYRKALKQIGPNRKVTFP